MSTRFLLAVALGLVSWPTAADTSPCSGGTVFEDRNGNGRLDRRERGIAGVRLSDGVRIVSSDRNGVYRLPVQSGRSLFLIKPAGYRVARRADGLPDTWTNWQTEPGPRLEYGGVAMAVPECKHFALQRESRRDGLLDVLVLGDPQPKSLTDIDYYRRDIVEPLLPKPGAAAVADLAVSLGDLVNDDLSLYPALKAVDAQLGLPWLHAAGNHDLDFDATRDEDSLASFRHAFGPDTYAWEEDAASFIVLDDVIYQPGRKPTYIGGLREDQFAFLEAYLPTLPKQRLLVLSAHIHFYDAVPGTPSFRHADRERLFRLLSAFPHVLLLTAHDHAQRQVLHGRDEGWLGAKPLLEFNAGAACGGYWSGTRDAQGIPAATMSDGTPNGYTRLRIRHGGEYELRFFPARESPDRQIGLHAPRVLRRGAYPGNAVYANVFMGRDDTVVEFRIDGGDWRAMRKVLQPDPAVLVENIADDLAPSLRTYDRLPEASPSPHLWRGGLPTDLDLGAHRIEVRAKLETSGWASATTEYRLEAAP